MSQLEENLERLRRKVDAWTERSATGWLDSKGASLGSVRMPHADGNSDRSVFPSFGGSAHARDHLRGIGASDYEASIIIDAGPQAIPDPSSADLIRSRPPTTPADRRTLKTAKNALLAVQNQSGVLRRLFSLVRWPSGRH